MTTKKTNSKLLPMNIYPSDDDGVTVESIKIKYIQSADNCATDFEPQTLTIKTEDAGSGTYFMFETKRWAVDSISDFIKLLEDFQSRIKIEKE